MKMRAEVGNLKLECEGSGLVAEAGNKSLRFQVSSLILRNRARALLGALRAAKNRRGGVLRGAAGSGHLSGIKTRQAGFAQGLQWVGGNGLDLGLAGNGRFEGTDGTNGTDLEEAAAAFEVDMSPVRKAMVEALQEGDLEALRGLRAMLPGLLGEVLAEPSLADVLAGMVGREVAEGLTRRHKDTKGEDDGALVNGAPKGHEFFGNQYSHVLKDEHWTGTPKEMHARAAAIMKTFTSVEHPKLGTVRFTKDGRNKTLFEKRSAHEFQSVKALPDLVRKGKWSGSSPDRKARQDVVAYHTLEANLSIGKAKYRAEITVKETVDGSTTAHKFYLHRLHAK